MTTLAAAGVIPDLGSSARTCPVHRPPGWIDDPLVQVGGVGANSDTVRTACLKVARREGPGHEVCVGQPHQGGL